MAMKPRAMKKKDDTKKAKMARGGMTKMARGGMTKKTKMARGGMTKKK